MARRHGRLTCARALICRLETLVSDAVQRADRREASSGSMEAADEGREVLDSRMD